MRRLALVFLAIALVAPASASAARSPALKISAGSAHVGSRVTGWFVVRNTGARDVGRRQAMVIMSTHGQAILVQKSTVPSLRPGARKRVPISAALPGLATGTWSIEACLVGRCRELGRVAIGVEGGPPAPAQPSIPGSSPPSPVPEEPLTYTPGEPFHHTAGSVEYWGFVPYSYDPATPTPLLIWLHGCGGESSGDIWVVDPGELEGEPQDWLTLALGGREGGCWDPPADESKVLEALANFETHFNVNPKRVILGGYSSGGDLAYRTGFFHSSTFAGLLIVNSAPFRDTGATEAELLGAATTKFHILHLAHEEDETYELAEVRSEVEAVKDAGFPIELIEVPGEHWNDPGDIVEGAPVPGTDADILTYLLPHIDEGWESP
ncbi:MAG TPA: hypothetical protein VMH33_01250 [Solirubrobacterales bacterium]|nr:hypothetical protein [Solirubrobacterales bacterium]